MTVAGWLGGLEEVSILYMIFCPVMRVLWRLKPPPFEGAFPVVFLREVVGCNISGSRRLAYDCAALKVCIQLSDYMMHHAADPWRHVHVPAGVSCKKHGLLYQAYAQLQLHIFTSPMCTPVQINGASQPRASFPASNRRLPLKCHSLLGFCLSAHHLGLHQVVLETVFHYCKTALSNAFFPHHGAGQLQATWSGLNS